MDAVHACCRRRAVSPGELVTAVRLLLPPARLQGFEDPGEPSAAEVAMGWHRSRTGRLRRVRDFPLVVLMLREELDPPTLRRCLAAALALEDPDGWRLLPKATIDAWEREWRDRERQQAMDTGHVREMLRRLAFRPIEGGVRTPAQAARILGLASEFGCTEESVSRRFRELAPVFHPDTGLMACPDRMRQLVEARKILLAYLKA
ncbi:J domain-containing protein [Arenibaculum pallidiluteum]|uniref:J domain-containing protein n=1 Tax=Arenibaculum pallidiluteum TaxID=2812559 RepID=UPI001A97B63A|nr:J domain-containing protein [Arenibaculum pallidiluteum]